MLAEGPFPFRQKGLGAKLFSKRNPFQKEPPLMRQNPIDLRAVLTLAALLLFAQPGAEGAMATVRLGGLADGKASSGPRGGKLQAFAVETATPPNIDGQLTDEAWAAARPIKLMQTLDGGGRASQATEFRLLRDAKTLYIGVRCTEPLLEKVQGARRAHDADMWSDDFVELFLSVPNSGTYYHFAMNSFGSTYDGQEKSGGWNADMKAAGAKGKGEWTVE